MLDTLYEYTTKWSLNVNISKTKIVVFGNGGSIKENEKQYYDNHGTVDRFTYLGCILNYNDKFNTLLKKMTEQGRKALFTLQRNVKSMCLNHTTLLSLFDTYVCSVLNYGCEIWGAM